MPVCCSSLSFHSNTWSLHPQKNQSMYKYHNSYIKFITQIHPLFGSSIQLITPTMPSTRKCSVVMASFMFLLLLTYVSATRPISNTSAYGMKLSVSVEQRRQTTAPLWYMVKSAKKNQSDISDLADSKSKMVFKYESVALVTEMNVGNPPQLQKMVIDTGSELSWLTCSPSSYNPTKSTTHRPVVCQSPTCKERTRDFPIPTSCDDQKLCHFANSYADGTSVEGHLATDTFHVVTPSTTGLVFGCSATPTSDGTMGIIGLNKGSLSFISQLKTTSQIPRKFSLCIPSNLNNQGNLYLGESPMAKYFHYTPLVSISLPLPYFDRSAYSVRVEGIKVGNTLLPIRKSVFLPDHTGAGQTMIDSATHFTMLLGEAYTPLKQEFIRQNMAILGNPLNNNFVYEGVLDLCYTTKVNVPYEKLSPVTLLFGSAQLSIQGKTLMFDVPDNNMKVSCFSFGNSDLLAAEANIIGNHHQQDLWVEYDLENSRVGFAKAPC